MARTVQTIDLAGVFSGAPPTVDHRGDKPIDAILDATLELMSSYGMRRWSMDDVAARAGVGRATLYRRFDSRHELVQTTLRREATRFFAAITEAVDSVEGLEEKVVEGFLIGLTLARTSVVPPLIAGSLPMVVTEGRRALLERYERMIGRDVTDDEANAGGAGGERHEAEVVAETLIRLGLSLLTVEESVIDFENHAVARGDLARFIHPLLAPLTA